MGSYAQQYFSPPLLQQALNSYSKHSAQLGWPLTHKLDLYNRAKVAFGAGKESQAERREAFEEIYENLRRFWQVFRPGGSHWTSAQIFEALVATMAPYSRVAGATLLRLEPTGHDALITALERLRPLKTMISYPGMAVSKFLHFFNPSLFPIYDNRVIENGALKRFKLDYETFLSSSSLTSSRYRDVYLLRYSAWARSLILAGGSGLMTLFAKWFCEQVSGHPDPQTVCADVNQYYATAYEFIVVGAALSE
jgi:hypothetical protein